MKPITPIQQKIYEFLVEMAKENILHVIDKLVGSFKSMVDNRDKFDAEVEEVARRRAEEAIKGRKPRTVRTDDIPGHVNDPFFDITCKVDAKGNPIPGASAQMKFVGSSPEAAVDKMLTKQYHICKRNV